jgi:hypothetical protein
MKEVRKGADKFGKHRKNMYKYSRDSLSEDSSDNEDQVVDYDEDIEDYDEDEYDTFRPHK